MNLHELLKELSPHVELGANSACFRGQSAKWPLLPKAYRLEFAGPKGEFIPLADSRMRQWEAEALPYMRDLGPQPATPWGRIALAQHFGLATRLLDWTSNPLVAIFFAVHGNEDKDAEIVVWRFDSEIYNNVEKHPDQTSDLVLFRPPHSFLRLKFQQGLLSLHPRPEVLVPEPQLTRLSIPAETKSNLQTELQRIGVDHETIFGTLDHLAEKINSILSPPM
jgi:hypothetical protein